jgi:superfamily II DNA or RNA helicase
MLRDQQVQLVQEFMSAFADPARGSTCQQLIMGAGKTTVVCPLIALMLADGARLAMQVVPRALLEFSRCRLAPAQSPPPSRPKPDQ